MARPPSCNHNDRYKSGHCKICTRKRFNAWRATRRAAARYARRLAEFGIERPAGYMTIEDLTGRPAKRDNSDLL